MAYLYSDLILRFKDKMEANGLHEIPSLYIKTYGDTVFQDHEVTDRLLEMVLSMEMNGRAVIKYEMEKEMERSRQAIAKNREELIDMQLKTEVQKHFPKDKIQKPFDTIYDGFMANTIAEMKKRTKFDLDDRHNLTLGEIKETHPENMSDLDKLLYDAKVMRFSRYQAGIEDIIFDSVKANGGDRFFQYFKQ